jgi:hypothetical protein
MPVGKCMLLMSISALVPASSDPAKLIGWTRPALLISDKVIDL